LEVDLRKVEDELGLPHPELRPTARLEHCYSLSDIYTDEMEQKSRDIYSRDYQMFGFGDWG
jgi:hypothetical protein